MGRFQTTSQTYYDDVDVRATVELIVEFEPKLESFTEHLIDMKTAQSRVYLMYARYETVDHSTINNVSWNVIRFLNLAKLSLAARRIKDLMLPHSRSDVIVLSLGHLSENYSSLEIRIP